MRGKNVISLFLALVLTLTLGACTVPGNNPADSTTAAVAGTGEFRVGYGKVEITPEESVPLAGFGNVEQRMSTGYIDRLYTTCIAVTDSQGNTILLFASDLASWFSSVAVSCREFVANETGIPYENILFSASHTHSGPSIVTTSNASISRYNDTLAKNMAQAALDALASQAAAKMHIASVEIEGLNFVRHYELADGKKVGYESMIPAEGAVAHAGIGDYNMQLLKFTREGEKDIVLMNWQGHPTRTSAKKYDVSADVVGQLCIQMEEKMDCYAAYFQGAAGNMNLKTEVLSEEFPQDYKDHAAAVIQQVMDANLEFTEVFADKVTCMTRTYTGKVNHEEDHMVDSANIVQAFWNQSNDRKESDALAAQYGIRSVYHAGSIITRSKLAETADLDMIVASIGDVGIVSAPYEMFAGSGLQIKERSPFAMTFIAGYASGHQGYIPSTDAFEYEGYETDNTKFVRGTAEELVEGFVNMLEEIHG